MAKEKYIVKVNGEKWFLCDSFSDAIQKCEQVRGISKAETNLTIVKQVVIETEFEYIGIA